jgi:hypothetical protein
MDITGARWSAEDAEAVLKLRAIRTNDDFENLLAPPPSSANASAYVTIQVLSV